jgi:hypothetical protein
VEFMARWDDGRCDVRQVRGVFGRTAPSIRVIHVTGNGNDERLVGLFGLRTATESVGHPTDTLLKSNRASDYRSRSRHNDIEPPTTRWEYYESEK